MKRNQVPVSPTTAGQHIKSDLRMQEVQDLEIMERWLDRPEGIMQCCAEELIRSVDVKLNAITDMMNHDGVDTDEQASGSINSSETTETHE